MTISGMGMGFWPACSRWALMIPRKSFMMAKNSGSSFSLAGVSFITFLMSQGEKKKEREDDKPGYKAALTGFNLGSLFEKAMKEKEKES